MAIGGIGGGSPISRTPPSTSANETQGLDKETLMKALQGDPKAIEQLAKKLGMDPEQLKELLKALGGGEQAGGKPEAGGGGGKPGGAEGGGKPGGAEGGGKPGGAEGAPKAEAPPAADAASSLMSKFAENIQKGMPPQQALAQAVSDVKAEQAKAKGDSKPAGHSQTDSYEAAPGQGPVDLKGAPPAGNAVPPPVEPPSI